MDNNIYTDCTNHDKETLLSYFFYRMTWEDRAALMRELPGAYNRYVGQKCVVVGRAIDNPNIIEL